MVWNLRPIGVGLLLYASDRAKLNARCFRNTIIEVPTLNYSSSDNRGPTHMKFHRICVGLTVKTLFSTVSRFEASDQALLVQKVKA